MLWRVRSLQSRRCYRLDNQTIVGVKSPLTADDLVRGEPIQRRSLACSDTETSQHLPWPHRLPSTDLLLRACPDLSHHSGGIDDMALEPSNTRTTSRYNDHPISRHDQIVRYPVRIFRKP